MIFWIQKEFEFDAIVWSSAKTNTVTAQGIKEIRDAVTDSLGMFRNISAELGATTNKDDQVAEILEYLEEFNILLILDNLETVIDTTLKDFFDRLPAGSKVMTTSRIGLGEFERRLNLTPMTNAEGAKLLRAVSRVRGIMVLAEAQQKRLNEFSNKLKNNPGFIKWFVASVQAGVRPEMALQNTSVFLNFCLENVYGYIKSEGRKILDVMQAVSRPLSIPEMSYISALEPIRLQSAIHQLLQTNMLNMNTFGDDNSSESRYGLSELARAYLVKKHSVGHKDYQRFKEKEREIIKMHGQIIGGFSTDPNSNFRISVRNKSDTVIASYLKRALDLAKKLDQDGALELVEKAKELSPGFYEVHRVDAWVNVKFGNILAAKTAYEAAYELADDDVNLIIWYAGFLFRNENEAERSLELLNKALEISPENLQVKLERCRILGHFEDFDTARHELVLNKPLVSNGGTRLKRIFWDLLMQVSDRKAERCRSTSDYEGILDAVDEYLLDLEGMPRDCIDFRQTKRLNSLLNTLKVAAQHLFDSALSDRCAELLDKVQTEMEYVNGGSRRALRDDEADESTVYEGTVVTLDKHFGFVSSRKFDENVYFRRSQFEYAENIRLKSSDRIQFQVGYNDSGRCAVNCRRIQ